MHEFFEFRAHLFRKRCVVTAIKKGCSQEMKQADQIKFIYKVKQRCKLQARAHVELQCPLSLVQLLAVSGDAEDAWSLLQWLTEAQQASQPLEVSETGEESNACHEFPASQSQKCGWDL
jgi:hypothetical protein